MKEILLNIEVEGGELERVLGDMEDAIKTIRECTFELRRLKVLKIRTLNETGDDPRDVAGVN